MFSLDDLIVPQHKPSRKRRTYQSGTGDFMWRSGNDLLNMYDMTPEHRENAMELCRRRGNSGKLKQLEQVQREMEKVNANRNRLIGGTPSQPLHGR